MTSSALESIGAIRTAFEHADIELNEYLVFANAEEMAVLMEEKDGIHTVLDIFHGMIHGLKAALDNGTGTTSHTQTSSEAETEGKSKPEVESKTEVEVKTEVQVEVDGPKEWK